MAILYSASAQGFFDEAIHADLPADAVKISRARHAELLAAQATGATIVAADNGRPVILRLTTTLANRRAAAVLRVKRHAARLIDAFAPAWRQLNDLRAPSPAGAARFALVDAIRAASDAIEREIAAMSAVQIDALSIPDHAAWPPVEATLA